MKEADDNRTHCPKCGVSIPAGFYEAAGATCPSCGLVFWKYRAAQDTTHQTWEPSHPDSSPDGRWLSSLLAVPESVSRGQFYVGMLGWVLFAIWGVKIATLDYRTGGINQSFLHGPLLVFHEAGHVIFRLFGEFATVLGGTLGHC